MKRKYTRVRVLSEDVITTPFPRTKESLRFAHDTRMCANSHLAVLRSCPEPYIATNPRPS